jgi:hypothetical protein
MRWAQQSRVQRIERKNLGCNDRTEHLGTGHRGGYALRSAWVSLLYIGLLNLLPSH